MQSTVFGCYNKYSSELGENTRFDYDEIYGTVMNRFLIQGLLGLSLSVYGDGDHSSGIMVLEDATNSLSSLRNCKIDKAQYQVINNNPRSYKIIELAKKVKLVLEKTDLSVDISINKFDPRNEKDSGGTYPITTAETAYFNRECAETEIEIEIQRSMEIVLNHMDRVDKDIIYPKLDWSK
tara:strand:- start:504 stop:1043 length:540 start_codon:yes stop_codon:yes gene_type:complete